MEPNIHYLAPSKCKYSVTTLALMLALCASVFAAASVKSAKLVSTPATPQQPVAATAAEVPTQSAPGAPSDPLGRETPRGTVLGFLAAVESGDFERAGQYLNTTKKGDDLTELANQLAYVLNNSPLRRANISDNPEGTDQAGLSKGTERIIVVSSPDGPVNIDLGRVQRDNVWIWRFSPPTLKNVPGAYEFMKDAAVDKHLPTFLTKPMWLFVPLWKYLALFLGFLIAIFAAYMLRPFFARVLLRFFTRHTESEGDKLVKRLTYPMIAIVWLIIANLMVFASGLPLYARTQWITISSKIWIGTIVWLILAVVNVSALAYRWRIDRAGSSESLAFVRLIQRIVNFICISIGVVVFLHLAGFDVTALVAGLGVGGIAIAFAAQKTLENFFGGIMLVFDKPIRVGDQCRIGDNIATVEDIGLRSTRLRSVERTTITVPNGQFSTMILENLTMRDKFLFRHSIGLRTDTSAERLEKLLAELRAILEGESAVDLTTSRVRLIRVDSRALVIELYCLIRTRDNLEFLRVQELLLVKTLHAIDENGILLATPIYYSSASDAGADS